MTEGKIRLGRGRDLAGRCPVVFELEGEAGVLFHIDGKWFAVRNRCPHQQFEKLHEGEREGTIVTCPMHGWKFDLLSGHCINAGGNLRIWSVTEDKGEIVVEKNSEWR